LQKTAFSTSASTKAASFVFLVCFYFKQVIARHRPGDLRQCAHLNKVLALQKSFFNIGCYKGCLF
jgi:hypothetical protein